MKVCMLTTSFPSHEGHSRTPFIYSLAKVISKKVELDVICPYYKNSKDDFESIKVHRFWYWIPSKQTLTERGGIPSEIRSSWYSRLQFIPFCLAYMFKILRVARKADVIHANWLLSGALALPTKWIFKKKIVLNERGSNLNMLNKSFLGKLIAGFIVSQMDYVVANNKHQIELLKYLKVKTKVIYNGIEFDKNVKKIENDRPIILFVGNLVKEKGVIDLVEALSEVRGFDFECYFVGDGILREKLEDMSKVLGVKTKFTGAIPFNEVAKYYASANLFVFPSWEEGRPNVLIEAMAYNLPVIAYDIHGVREIITNDYNGMLVKLKDISAFAHAVSSVLKDDKLRLNLKKNSAEWFKKNELTWGQAADKFIKVYKEIY